MSISLYGWGGCGAITTLGWGSVCLKYTVTTIIAKYLCDREAHSCVITRDYLEIKTRDKDQVLLRLKSDSVPTRVWNDLVSRVKEDVISTRNVC